MEYAIGFFAALILAIVIWIAVRLASPSPKESERAKPLMRACPLCGHELRIGENILAERTGLMKEGREKIVIKGCSYCLGNEKFLLK